MIHSALISLLEPEYQLLLNFILEMHNSHRLTYFLKNLIPHRLFMIQIPDKQLIYNLIYCNKVYYQVYINFHFRKFVYNKFQFKQIKFIYYNLYFNHLKMMILLLQLTIRTTQGVVEYEIESIGHSQILPFKIRFTAQSKQA